jgi:hypothetical protein
MSTNDFLTKQNVDLLWEVIIDDDLFKNKPKELINQIGSIFTSQLRGFNEAEKNNSSNLMNMNKRFIGLMLNHSRSIIISNKNPVKTRELITSTDLQTERMSQFEKDLSQRQNEFTSAMTLPVPPVPKFSDGNLDEPMSEMELAIKKALEQRNYDIEQVSKNLNKSNADTWLKPQETSLKSEKIVPLKNQKTDSNPYYQTSHVQNTLKYIKIDNEDIENTVIKKDIIDLSKQKHISWEDENINLQIAENEQNKKDEEDNIIETNIFKKLKKINPEIDDQLSINNRMNILEDKINGLNNKIDLMIKILQS